MRQHLQNSQKDHSRNSVHSVNSVKIFLVITSIIASSWFTNLLQASSHTQATLISEKEIVAPGESFEVGILLRMDKGWHIYWKDPGDSGFATSIEWKVPQGFTAGPIRWPKPKIITESGLTIYGYENEVLLLTEIKAPGKGCALGASVPIEAQVRWLECEKTCIPGEATVTANLRLGTAQNSPSEILALFEKYRQQIPPEDYHPSKESSRSHPSSLILHPSLLKIFFFAFIGGVILNLMPCVLPVLAIKILSFISQSQSKAEQTRRLGLYFALGVLVSFWILAGLVIGLQVAGHQIGWGFQFHNPRFLITMAFVVTMIALNFFEVFEINLAPRALGAAGNLASREGNMGAFFNGVLATTLATPCTAPFLAPALGFAFTQSVPIIFSIFSAVGIGMAFPYVVLSWNPTLLKWLPKPGTWMIRFKQAMGFPMLATALWLVWILSSSYGNHAAFIVAAWLLLSVFVIWVLQWIAPSRLGLLLLACVLMLALGYYKISPFIKTPASSEPTNSPDPIPWQPYSESALREALQTPYPILIDFTADWCLTCQVNQQTSLKNPKVVQRMKDLHAIPFLADWTRSNKEITAALRSFERSGVPLYVIYPVDRNKPPIVLPEVLTPQIVLSALDKAAEN